MSEDTFESLVAALEAHQQQGDMLLARLRAATRAPAVAHSALIKPKAQVRPRYVFASAAFRDRGYEFDEQKVRRICKRNRKNFAVLLGGTWYAKEPEFSKFADRVESGETDF